MNKLFLLPLLLIFCSQALSAQFVSQGGDTLYGNEWIDFEKEYYKVSVSEDGIYRISYQGLNAAGVPLSDLEGSNFQLLHKGSAYPIYVSENGSLGEGDYIEFYGRKNRGEMDEIFYEDAESMQLNPEYSLFTDTSAYYLTWNLGSENLRVNEVITPSGNINVPEQDYYMHKERRVLSNRVHKPTRNGADNVRYSHFDIGEGFGGNLSQKNEVTLSASEIFEGGPNPSIDIRFTSNGTAHEIDFQINGDQKALWKYFGYECRQEHVDFTAGELKSNNTITLQGLVDQFDRNIISIVDLNYARKFDFDNADYFEFFVKGGFVEKLITIDNFDGGEFPVIYDPGSASRIIPREVDGKYQMVIPGSPANRSLIAFNSDEAVREVLGLEKMNFVDYSEMEGEFIIISHPRLMGGSDNVVEEYASYRSSAAGGGFQSVVINVEDLYEQFSYGIKRHSYSVKNFVNWAAKNWADPQYVFLIGKGREYGVYRTQAQIEDLIHRSYYLPTFGMPGSDNLLVSEGAISTAHRLATGRLAAKDVNDVRLYLDKVKEHESFDSKPQTIDEKLWKKRIMHLAGAETSLQESIGTYLETMEESIEESQYGASVVTFKKSSTETIQEADADALLSTIDAGLSVLTFFGHSSVGTFDFNIDDVNKLKNFGKYPLVISLGCFSGNVHTQSYGISEQYVLTASKGAIAFMASSSTAYVAPQGGFGEDYYTKLGNEFYGQSLGKIFQSTLIDSDDLTTIHAKILNEQMTLHGDPAIKLSEAEGPDYLFDISSFATDPTIIESNQSEFDLNFKVANLGLFVEDSLSIKLDHFKSNGSLGSSKEFKIKAPKFDTLVSVTFQNDDNANVGKNIIKGRVDYTEDISELPLNSAEENNDIEGGDGFVFFSINNSAVPVSPCDFAIYNEEQVVLRASTYNALSSKETKYIIELDSTALFDSPMKQTYEINSIGGLLEWTPEMSFEHGHSYYWRVSPDSVDTEIGYRWEDASFVYLPNSSNGWNQSHYYQFLDNEYDGIYVDEESRDFEFDTSGFFIKIFNSVWDPNITGYQFNFETYATSVRPWNFMNSGIAVVVGDQFTGSAWINSGGDFGSINTSNFGSFRCFGYPTDSPENREKLMDLLESEAPDGSFVWFFSVLRNFDSDFAPANWLEDESNGGRSIFDVLEDQGAVLSREMIEKGSVPYNFIYQKGFGKISEEIGESNESLVTSTAFIPVRGSQGSITSSKIGPAKTWDRLLLGIDYDNGLDTTIVTIVGISESSEEILLTSKGLESELDLSFIDSETYPYLRLDISSKDESVYTPGQLDSWRVLYEGYPDLAINTSEAFVFNRDTLQAGEPLKLSLRLDNYNKYDLDSAFVNIVITDEMNQSREFQDVVRFDGLENPVYNFTYNTSTLLGKYQISLSLNPERQITEKTYLNNFGVREFVVIGDVLNPTLEVSFDGNKIIDGDIVSASPFINIELLDENQYLLLNDPDVFEVAIFDPNGQEEIVMLNEDDRINFIPALEGSKNKATIEFRPEFIVDGLYTLEVRASDRSSNISGDLDFRKSFEIITEEMISNILNYPNPFSTSTEFVFTLTGSEIPDEIKIQIMSVSGTIVKEIFKEELGPLQIGLNRTSYKWDGTDDYGVKLANGVYLYRVVAKHQNENVSNFEISETNDFFKNKLGKLVILR